MAHDAIKAIARRTAQAGLRLRDASALFDAIYRADALVRTEGNITQAAEIAGVERESFMRARQRDVIVLPDPQPKPEGRT